MTDEELVDALKALAHPVRLRILQALSGTERNVGEVDDIAAIGQPTLSQQLAELRDAGIIEGTREGKAVIYRVTDPRIIQLVLALRDLYKDLSDVTGKKSRRALPLDEAMFD